jgi:hypothetical protein
LGAAPPGNNQFVRRVLLAVLLLGLSASVALAAPRSSRDRIACEDVKSVDLLFWPKGHGVIPAFGPNSSFPTPHLEVYRAGVTANRGFLGFIGTSEWNLAKGCRVVDEEPLVRWGGGKKGVAKVTRRFRCRFPGIVELKTSQLANGGSRLQITVRHTAAAVVDASIRDVGSQLVYRTAFCKRVALLPGSTP